MHPTRDLPPARSGTDASAPLLQVRGMGKRYPDGWELQPFDLEVHPGEIVGLLGPNGAGKTTTLEGILALRPPDTGSVTILGMDALANPLPCREHIGALLQTTALPDAMTPLQALRMMGAFYRTRIHPGELLEDLGLTDQAHQRFHTLSGGQRQRLALALSLVNNPRLLLLDEPATGLDPAMRHELLSLLVTRKKRGNGILLATHLLEDAERFCDRVIILHNGAPIASGTPVELIRQAGLATELNLQTQRPVQLDSIGPIRGAIHLRVLDDTLHVLTSDLQSSLLDLILCLEQLQNPLLHLDMHPPSLESAYLALTQTESTPFPANLNPTH